MTEPPRWDHFTPYHSLAFLFAPNIGSRYGRPYMAENMKTSHTISKKMRILIFIPLMIPSVSLVGFALSDLSRDNASTMLVIAVFLFLINIIVFSFAYRALTKPEPQTTDK